MTRKNISSEIIFSDWKVLLLFLSVAQTLASISMMQLLNISGASLVRPFVNWNVWALFAFVLFRLMKRRLNQDASINKFLWVLIAAGPIIAAVQTVCQSLLLNLIENKPLELSYFLQDRPRFINRFLASINCYIVLAAGAWAYSRYHSLHKQRLQSLRNEAQLAETELKITKNEMHLTEVLDSLRSIRGMLKGNAAQAEFMTARLARSLRKSLTTFHSFENQKHPEEQPNLRTVQKRKRKIPKAVIILAVWTAIALCSLLLGAVFAVGSTVPFNWLIEIKENLSWYIWAALTPLVLGALNRFPIDPFNLKHAILHLVFGIFLSVVAAAIYITVRFVAAFDPQTSYLSQLQLIYEFPIVLDLVTYWGVVAVAATAGFSVKKSEEQTRSANLEAGLYVAQLNLLRMQLHPHFLFNTLNMVCELMHEDPEVAEKILVNIEEYLKYSINKGKGQEVELSTELELLKFYLQIQEARFQDKLHTKVNVPENLLNHPVPNLILQPLVENAIRHGLSSDAEKMEITVSAERKEGKTILYISDNGKGITGKFREGIGISNIRRRLKSLYGSNHMFSIANSGSGGVTVVVGVPERGVS